MVKLSYEKNLVVLLPFFCRLLHNYLMIIFQQLLGLTPLFQDSANCWACCWANPWSSSQIGLILISLKILFILLRRKNDKNVYFMAQRIRIWVQFDFVIVVVIFVSQLQHSKSRSRNNLDLLIFEIANILKAIMTNNLITRSFTSHT